MNELGELVFAAILSTAGVQYRGVNTLDEWSRLFDVATDIADVVEEEGPLCDGPAADECSALALVAIADHESNFMSEVQDCRRTGDAGRSISLYQLQRWGWGGHDRAELCDSHRLSAELAYRFLRRGALDNAMRIYAGRERTGRELYEGFEKAAKKAGLRVETRAGKTWCAYVDARPEGL
jgi:hypothetical protein